MRHHLATFGSMALTSVLIAAGCWGGGESQPPASGDPEADQRAEMRVESEDGKGGGAARAGTLFERLGGEQGVRAIVDDMAERVIADPRVNFERKDVDQGWLAGEYKAWKPTPEHVEAFKRRMVEFISVAAGGPAEYTGREMESVHKGMRITNNEFDAMVGDIKASMDRLGIGAREKKDLLAIIETTRKQIVEQR